MTSGGGDSPLQQSGHAADQNFGNRSPDSGLGKCPGPSEWVEIQLIGEDGKGIGGVAYRLQLPDGKVIEGKLDGDGIAAVEGIDPGTCVVTFPELDKEAWEPAAL